MNAKIILIPLAIIAIALALVLADPPREPDPRVGLVINPPDRSVSLEQLGRIYSDAASSGIGRSNVYMFWNIVEPQRGEFDWRNYDALFDAAKQNGLRTTLFFSIINGVTLGPFPDWMGNPQLGSVDSQSLVKVLDAALSRYDSIDAVIIAGQTESQFRRSEHNMPAYEALFSEVYDGVRAAHPDVRMGNSFALHHVLNKDLEHIVKELSDGDFAAFSYWPVDSLNDIVKTPSEAGEDLKKVFEMTPGNVAFFEIGWSTSGFVGGDDASQKEFVGVLFDFYGQNESKIEFLTWYKQHDMSEGTCGSRQSSIGDKQVELDGSGLGGNEHVIERLDRYVCNAGLLKTDGTAKPGWDEFKKRAGMQN
ncbi:MAG: hypothetical protein EB829_06530 [Nitrosopumilus sp. H8]|nr:MAG: hypothetical protein EB829_06530 [Nitrosopumilus sp. H8]